MKQMLSASCSMAPDSRRSESCGRLLFSLAGLDGAIELAERDDRELQLLGEPLQPAGDLADLLLARAARSRPSHELEVVDDDEADALLPGRPSSP
jgi:hypothetical protein